MSHIYKAASKVLIWLGEEEESDAETFNLLKKFNSGAGSVEEHAVPQLETDDLNLLRSVTPSQNVPANWGPVSFLLKRPWFTRAGLYRR